jgi:hypothetical protein
MESLAVATSPLSLHAYNASTQAPHANPPSARRVRIRMEPCPAMKHVIEGHEGFLFLTGGAHTPALYSRGEKAIPKQSLTIFWNNQKWRQTALGNRKIRHIHLIAPDKHSVCPEVFPEEILVSVGKTFLQAAPNAGLASSVLYPVDELSADFRRNCSRVDTHFTPHGTGVICLSLLRALAELEAEAKLARCLAMPEKVLGPWTGDLGHRFNPPRTEPKVSLKIGGQVSRYHNNLRGNNGIIDLLDYPARSAQGRLGV